MSQVATLPKRSLVDSMAAKYDMEPSAFVNAIKATVIKGDCSNEQFAAFLMVAKEYDLNPLTKEIYAFPDRGGITPIVSIDGWMNLINSHPQFDGMEFTDTTGDDGKLYSVECRMYRKDRARPVSVIEYMSECFRQTDPWKKWPNRMLRHKAAIQCARYAFGFSGIMEPDEYERMKDVTPTAQPTVMDRLKAARNITPDTQEPADEQEGFSRSFVAEQTDEPHDALTGEIIEPQNAGEDIPAQPADDAASATAASTEGDGIAAQSSSPSSLWLLNIARMLWAATNYNGDVSILKAQKLAAVASYPKPDDCPAIISGKAESVYAYCKQITEGSLEPDDGLAIIAGVVGCDQDDLKHRGE